MPKAYKVDKVAELKEKLEVCKDFIIADYRGLSVKEIGDLRGKLREHGVALKVVKNNLARLALEQLGVKEGGEYFAGPTSIAFAGEEAPAAAKVLSEFEKGSSLKVKAGFVDGVFYGPEGVIEISKLPSKKDLLAQILGGMEGLLSRFAGDMQSVLQTFVGTLKAIEDKKAS